MTYRFGRVFYPILVLVIMSTGVIHAAFLHNVPVHVKQPDGTVLSCLASGDEFYNWLHDKDGFTIVRNAATGFLVYADKVEGKLVPTEFIAGRTDPLFLAQAGIQKNLLDDPKPREQVLALPVGEQVFNAPRTGTINNLVVGIRFSDQEEFAADDIDLAKYMFNSTDAGVSSMRNYYAEASYNQLAISTTFYPGSTPGVFSYQDSNPRAYYMPYDATTNPTGYSGDTERRIREHTLLQNAVNAISAEVPAGLNIDADGDTYVDNVCFIVKGEPTAWNTLLWPHMWSLSTYSVYINAKRVSTYNFQMETTLDVGVLCHEMFHSLGAPDLYHYSYDGLHPAWAWDLMEYNLDPPEHMTAYMKWKYGTWIASIPEITTSGTYTLHPLKSATNNCYKIASPGSSTEYFVLEYRKKTNGGTFEGNLYNEGLLVYRINTTVTGGNRNGPPDELYIYRPGGTTTLDGQPGLAPFSAQQVRTQINDSTDPSSFLTSGSPGGLSIFNVGYYGDTISFDVAINTITVTSPNGGENWAALGTAPVTWTSSGAFTTVDILLSTDAGTSWTTLADNTPNDGSETVAVPLISSSTCFIRVQEGGSGVPNDTSNASFSIVIPAAPISVTSPNGGERWTAGSTYNITWTQTGLSGTATIDLYKNWVYQKTLGTADVTAGTFSWPISAAETAGSDYRVRITQGSAWDVSDANFSVVVPCALPFSDDFTSPNPNWVQQNIGSGITGRWGYSATSNAGGFPYEVCCTWQNVNPGTTRLITPPLDTTGRSSLRLRFKHFLEGYGTGCTLKVQTSPDRAVWTDEAWSIASTSDNVGPETIETTIEHNLGIVSTYVAFVITGNLYQFNYWYIDDVSISGSVPKVDFNNDGQEDILWRYYGSGGYNRAWFLGDTGLETRPLPMLTYGADHPGPGISPIGISPSAKLTKGRSNDQAAKDHIKATRATAPEDIMRSDPGKGARAFSVHDPREAGLRRPRPATRSVLDPRMVTSDNLPNAAASPSGELAAAPELLGGADVLPVGDLTWEVVGTGDFDNDSSVDILWRNNVSGVNVVWFMDGTDWRSSAELLPVGDLTWQIVGTGDFNKDTHVDILWRNSASGENVIWYLDGTTWIGSAMLLGVTDQTWQIMGTGDFDKDGNIDILWRYNGAGGYNVVWHLNNATWVGSSDLISVGDTAWRIMGTGDYNGDGNIDILWRYHGAGGYNVIWYMNGVSWSESGEILPVPDLNWRIVSR